MALFAARWRRPGIGWGDLVPPVDPVRTAVVCLALQRVSYLEHSLVKMGTTVGWPPLLALFGHAVWSTALLTTAWRRRVFRTEWVWADVVLTAVVELFLAWLVPRDPAVSTLDYYIHLDMSAATLAGGSLSARGAVGAVLVLVAGRSAATQLAGITWSSVLNRANAYVWWAITAWVLMRFLRMQLARAEQATARLVDLAAGRAAERARLEERWAQRARLHDTVLATLTAIARGGLDHHTDEVRQRCAREAEYVRRLVRAEDDHPTNLGEALSEVISDAEALGLRVRFAADRWTGDPPPAVIDAMSGAVREALNNVRQHSGGNTAWVTVLNESDGFSVRVVDRGPGGDRSGRPGQGIRESIVARMRAVGGRGQVDVVAGQGAYVELTWPSD